MDFLYFRFNEVEELRPNIYIYIYIYIYISLNLDLCIIKINKSPTPLSLINIESIKGHQGCRRISFCV
ncbi:MAG: hypothetical protein MCS20_02280, partial [Candidatus Phytoplasma mali]|nr:hypothetical protein [Candidatus Phytoplasma mali]MCZ8633072.1 hypothetical protein [Spiroplasma sp. Tabriz.8]